MKIHEPRVGQIWADNDKRAAGRTIRIERIEGTQAVCVVLTNSDTQQALLDWGSPHVRDTRGKTARISLVRLRPTSTGYRLIENAPKQDGSDSRG